MGWTLCLPVGGGEDMEAEDMHQNSRMNKGI